MPQEFAPIAPLDEHDCALPNLAENGQLVERCARIKLPAQSPPWQSTSVMIRAGQSYSVFASGRVQWAKTLPSLYGGPRFHLWLRVAPGGRIRNLREDTDTFVADVDGELQVCIYMGMWQDSFGTLATKPDLYSELDGGLDALIVTWHGDPQAGLAALAAQANADSVFAAEARHLRTQPPLPPGWQLLIETGETHLFAPSPPGEPPGIHMHGDDDQGILCRDCNVPLTPTVRLQWSWKLDGLPSACAENSARCHDYVSIATEFDDGRDLTWFWSSSLDVGHHFACPVKAWRTRETHFVVRTGSTGIGNWQNEDRPVWDDVVAAIGPPPGRIVRVWLIGVASFQHGTLRAAFRNIELVDGTVCHRIL